jgi:hypothetical protein
VILEVREGDDTYVAVPSPATVEYKLAVET